MTTPDPERIVAAARRMIESSGADALTMRKLAAELGVAHTAIYWHIGGRDELFDAVVDSFLADTSEIKARGTGPRKRMASIALQVHRQAVEHPALVNLAIEQGRSAALWRPAHDALAREVAAAGLTGAAAAKAVTTILYVAGAFVTLEATLEANAQTRATAPVARKVFTDALDAVLDSILK